MCVTALMWKTIDIGQDCALVIGAHQCLLQKKTLVCENFLFILTLDVVLHHFCG